MLKFRFLVIISLLVLSGSTFAASTSAVTAIQNKTSLTDGDKTTIGSFFSESFREIYEAQTMGEVVLIRQKIESVAPDGKNLQYSKMFSEVLSESLESAFSRVGRWEDTSHAEKIKLNFMILVANVSRVEMADFAISKLGDTSSVIRYWAFKALTSNAVAEQLKLDSNSAAKVLKAIEVANKTNSTSETTVLVARLCEKLKEDEANKILVDIAISRIEAYKSKKTSNEMLDLEVLKSLSVKIANETSTRAKSQLGWAFGQLYSYTIQTYVAGSQGQTQVSPKSLETLFTVIIEVERVALKNLGITQTSILKAIEKDNLDGLVAEHDALLGSGSSKGKLPVSLEFGYGKPDGTGEKSSPDKL